MNPTFTFPPLEQMNTPIFICNAKGVVIFKNAAAMRQIRLPRRNTSVRSHLRQAEEGELDRISTRKKPSLLTLHSGDRPMRALVVPYANDDRCGPALLGTEVARNEVCSLWIFPAVLQVFSTSIPAQYIESVAEDLSGDLCILIKQADQLSGLLPGREKQLIQEKMDRKVLRMLDHIERLPEGRWFDLRHAVQILLPLLHRRLEIVGAELEYTEEENAVSYGQAVDLPRMVFLLIHLITYCVSLSGSRAVSLRLCKRKDSVILRASFSLSWPPFTVTDSNDLRRLCLLLPSGQMELLVLESLGKGFGTSLTYTITEETENNFTLSVGLPITQRAMVRTLALSPTEQLFLERDLEAIFGAVWEEMLAVHTEENE